MTIITNEDYNNPADALHTEDISVMGLYPFSICMHASRQAMHLSQAGQMPPLCKTERAMVYHGVTDVKSIAIKTVVPYDSEVLRIVDNIILFKTIDDKLVYHIELPNWVGNHGRFGYRPKLMHKDIYVGQYFKKGDILAQPPSLDGDHFNTGTHLNVLVASFPGNAEDGCILSEAARDKLAYDTMSEITFEINEGDIPINKWGTDDSHMGLPRVGDIIGDDNTLCVLRNIKSLAMPGYLSPKALRHTQFGDKIQQSTDISGSEVMEVTVISNIHNQQYTHGQYCNQLDKLVDETTRKQKIIVDATEELIKLNKRRGLTTLEDPDLVNYIVAAKMMEGSRTPTERVKLTYRTKPAAAYMVTVKLLKRHVKPTRGGKLTDRSSAKITITSIWPADRMPTGVDIIVGPEGGTNRTIPSRGIEQWVNAGAVNAGNMVRSVMGYTRVASDYVIDRKHAVNLDTYSIHAKKHAVSKDTVIKTLLGNKNKLNACRKIVNDWSSVTNHNIKDVLSSAPDKPSAEYISDIMFHNMVTPLPITYVTSHLPWKICKAISKSIFSPQKVMLKGKNFDDSNIDFKYLQFVGPVYFSVLDKTPMDISSSASQILQVQGLPATRSHSDKFTSAISRYPSRKLGVDETQILSCALGGANVVNHEFLEMFDRLISKPTQEAEIATMLNSDDPSGHDTLVDRNKVPYGKGRSLQILEHLLKTHGVGLVMK